MRWLRLGADDAVSHDIHPLEFQARLRRVQHRYQYDLIQVGAWKLDPARQALWYEMQPIEMHEKEIQLLRALFSEPGRLHSSEQLARHLGQDKQFVPAVEGRLKQVQQRVTQKTGKRLVITLSGKDGQFHMLDAAKRD